MPAFPQARGESAHMTKFEDLGRELDRELERLRDIAEQNLGPKTAKALRNVSSRLTSLAEKLESKSTPKA